MTESVTWTHKKLVRRLAEWCKGTQEMKIVLAELTTAIPETPDVLGFKSGDCSTLIECKVSRSDFLADGKKIFRVDPIRGVGNYRFFAAPPGIIGIEELPDKWGLLEVEQTHYNTRGRICVKKEAEFQEANKSNECIMLLSALRRLQLSTAVYVVSEPTE